MPYYVYHIHRKSNSDLTDGYIGITNDYKSRWRHHKHHLQKSTHSNPHLQNAWLLYSGEIVFTLLHTCDNEAQMLSLEVQYRPTPNIGWNCKSGGTEYSVQSPETKNKIRTYNLGRKHSLEARKKQSEAKKGLPGNRRGATLSIAQREHLSNINIGKKHSIDVRKKVSFALSKYRDPKLWLHITGLYFYGSPFELRYTYPSHSLTTGALALVYQEKTNQHKGWYISE